MRVHTLQGCDLPPALARGNLELLALGDFAATNESAEILRLDRKGTALRFPVATQAVQARVDDGVAAFSGYGERQENALDVLLWPELSTCVVWQPDGARGYPGRHRGQALGYSESLGIVLAAGGNDPLVSDAIVGALSFDVATGALATLDSSDADVLGQPRAFATVTAFGDHLLVAGGEQPVFGVPESDLEPQATAELFEPKLGRFSAEPIQLRSSRTRHAALTLEDGRTLLVGGRSKVGATSIAQYQLEIVDPQTKRASVGDAIAARIQPSALRLSDGRVFVGGGVGLDGALTEPAAEWLTAGGRRDSTELSPEVAARFDRAFVATPGGGVLAVGGCEDRPAASEQDAAACAASCSHGCPPLAGYDAWWVDRDGAASPVRLDGISAPRPVLLPGSDGSPWLIAADANEPENPRLFRFNPWAQRFEPANVPSDLRLPRPGSPLPLPTGPDAFVWLDETEAKGQLLGLRLGTRSRYAQDLALVLLSEPNDPSRPQHLVPDRPLGGAASYDGALTLSGAAFRAEQDPPSTEPDVKIQVADTDYTDLTLKLHVVGDTLPIVLLGGTPLGGADCPWPDGTETGGDLDLPTIVRSGARAQLLFRGGRRVCNVESGRLALALRAGDGVSTVTQLDVERGRAER